MPDGRGSDLLEHGARVGEWAPGLSEVRILHSGGASEQCTKRVVYFIDHIVFDAQDACAEGVKMITLGRPLLVRIVVLQHMPRQGPKNIEHSSLSGDGPLPRNL